MTYRDAINLLIQSMGEYAEQFPIWKYQTRVYVSKAKIMQVKRGQVDVAYEPTKDDLSGQAQWQVVVR